MATPTEETIAAPIQDKMASPIEEPMGARVEEPWSARVEEPWSAPVEEPISAPAEEPISAPAEEPMAARAEEPMAVHAEEPMVAPIEEPMAAPVEELMASPVEESMAAPVEERMSTHYEEAMAAQFEDLMTAHFEEPLTTPINHKRATPDEDMMETPDEEKMLLLTPFEGKTATPYENNEVENTETQPNKRRKKKSIVWEHFTIKNVGPGCRRACCKQCKQSFAYSTGSKVAGTSHLKHHIAKGTCPALLRNQNKNQSSPYTPASRGDSSSNPPKMRYWTANTPQIIFDPDRCRHEISRMIIMHDYPLHMVEHPGFVAFAQNLNSQFNMVSFNTVQGDCVATYLTEKQSVTKFIEGIPGRVCLTLDMWSSSQSVGYVFITGHFIDADWKLHRRLLNVVMEPYPDSDSALSHAVAVCLHDWSMENKLFSVTYDQPLSETALENLRPLLSNKNPLILNGQLLVGHCMARTLNNIAKEVLAAGSDVVKKVRDSVKYVKTSESHEEKFLEL
ncbi:hypothetical protein C1H46_044004 [Malus baccata]|uniref:BED-type domain-containing protein n=1 Tax=Malus baccata TaxID=106549 RepID=A0A540K952_MALBA|nr:hypothetical protein C1H46_044004 [Malus baccata]